MAKLTLTLKVTPSAPGGLVVETKYKPRGQDSGSAVVTDAARHARRTPLLSGLPFCT